ncbi:MAG TPA: VTT domain-containing protein [Rudaea sp.]|nr:VTT domain-containing protein [Rudaea sp.]
MPILEPGRNCWRIEAAHRLAFLVDGAACFGAMRKAFAAAQHSIELLAWDIDSRMRLVPQGANDGLPDELGPFFDALTRRRRGLRVRLLCWDYAMLYALEREWLPTLKLGRRTHPHVAFALDGHHPFGASHHQKLVVIDDAIAFVGGLDPTSARWDTSEHRADEPLRRDAQGHPYRPFHDVHMVLEGPAARALGELARRRWREATGENVRAPPEREGSAWPEHVRVDLVDRRVGIARTAPAFGARPAVSEIRQLLLDGVAAAARDIYAEAQYFTADAVGEALCDRLREERGPEFVLVGSPEQSGWLQQHTMGVLRANLDATLRAADRYDRYRAYYPHVPELAGCLNVHSKLVIFDDRLLVLGSANLNNRSMGLDTELSIALEAGDDPRCAEAIARLRNRLLGEHLGCDPAEVAAAHTAHKSLIGAIDALRRDDGRSLREIRFSTAEESLPVPPPAVVDPERPIDPARLIAEIAADRRRRLRRRFAMTAAVAVVVGALAAVWLGTPIREWLDAAKLVGLVGRFGEASWAPFAAVAIYVIGGMIVVPVNVLIAVTVIVFGPLLGAVYALVGSLASAAALYEIGRHASRTTLRHWLGDSMQRLRTRLARHGVLAVTLVRIVPVAPYSVVNLVAGAAHVGRGQYLVGTALGMLPGIVLNAVFIDRILAVMEKPDPSSYALLAAVAVLVAALAVAIRRRLGSAATE